MCVWPPFLLLLFSWIDDSIPLDSSFSLPLLPLLSFSFLTDFLDTSDILFLASSVSRHHLKPSSSLSPSYSAYGTRSSPSQWPVSENVRTRPSDTRQSDRLHAFVLEFLSP